MRYLAHASVRYLAHGGVRLSILLEASKRGQVSSLTLGIGVVLQVLGPAVFVLGNPLGKMHGDVVWDRGRLRSNIYGLSRSRYGGDQAFGIDKPVGYSGETRWYCRHAVGHGNFCVHLLCHSTIADLRSKWSLVPLRFSREFERSGERLGKMSRGSVSGRRSSFCS